MDVAQLTTSLIDRYQIVRELGAGAMATVFLARDLRHDRLVALKVLDPALAPMLGGERFIREIRVTARLTHPNIIPLLDSGMADGLLYYVTPFAEGESLRSRLQREAQLPLPDALRIAREVADALDCAHNQNVVHRDVKPENILLVSGHAVVADFGIARAVDAATEGALTGTGISLGTPTYMSPEQSAGERAIDGRTDVYALGCVLYEMIVGEPPFRGPTTQSILAQHATQPAPSVRTIRPAIPERVDGLIAHALAKAPADRFRSAAEMRAALDEVGTLDTARTDGASSRRWFRPALVGGAAVALLVAIGAMSWRTIPRLGSRPAPASALASARLAILPMANLSPDPQDSYFADGMTDELISSLSNLSGLRVIARSSILGYAGTHKPVRDIGRELGANAVLESTCRKAGDRLRITVRLVDAESQEERWTEQYDRQLADVFAIQRDVAERVADALRVRLVPAEARRIARRPTQNLDAYTLYLRGKLLLNEQTNTGRLRIGLDSVIAMYTRAIELDPTFAQAHAALAHAYNAKMFNYEPGPKWLAQAAAEVRRALNLDSTLAEAYSARGDLAYTREGGWRIGDAMRDYMRALALEPNFADAHAALGSVLFHAGLLERSRQELETALTLDPLNRFVPPRIPRVLWFGQHYDSALTLMEHREQFGEEHALVLGYLGRANEGLTYLDGAPQGEQTKSDFAAVHAVLLARVGRRDEAEREIQRAITLGQATSHFHHAEFAIASAYAIMGQRDAALQWVARTAEDGMPAFTLFANDPSLATLRRDQRFEAFITAERARHEQFAAILRERQPPLGH